MAIKVEIKRAKKTSPAISLGNLRTHLLTNSQYQGYVALGNRRGYDEDILFFLEQYSFVAGFVLESRDGKDVVGKMLGWNLTSSPALADVKVENIRPVAINHLEVTEL